MIATIPEVPMLIPRGKYSFDFYATFAKLHGRTNDYKILYKDITKCFLLPKPGGVHMAYLLQLTTPLRQGQTLHHFIALQFDKEKQQKVIINLSKEQIKDQYNDKLEQEIEGPLYDVLSKLFKNLVKVNILIPGEFKSSKDGEAIKCSVKASDGYLYPLKSSLVFIHKPVHYIKLSEIKYVEFSRVGGAGVGMPSSRSFDMTVTKIKEEPAITFAGIDKQEHKNLINYLKSKNIKMRSVDVETNREIDLSDGEEEEEDGSERPQKGGRRGAQMDDYDDEDEDDESFKDEGSDKEGDDEEGGEDEEDESDESAEDEDEDADMDEGIDKDELKALQKEAAGVEVSGTRRTRGGARSATDKNQSSAEKPSKKK